MWDDSRLHAARSYTPSPDSPFSLRSSFTQSTHLLFGLSLLLPCTYIPIALFPTYSSSLLSTCPYHRILRYLKISLKISENLFENLFENLCENLFENLCENLFEIVFEISPTFVLPPILSNLTTPHIHRNIFIYATCIIFSCAFFTTTTQLPQHNQPSNTYSL